MNDALQYRRRSNDRAAESDQHHYRYDESRLLGVPPIDAMMFKHGIAEDTKSPSVKELNSDTD